MDLAVDFSTARVTLAVKLWGQMFRKHSASVLMTAAYSAMQHRVCVEDADVLSADHVWNNLYCYRCYRSGSALHATQLHEHRK